MYERNAIVLERYFENLFGFNKENNLRTNYENYGKIIEQVKEYQEITEEEERVIGKFDEVATEIEDIQKEQAKLYESNLELERERNILFNDLGENPNTLDSKLQKIEEKMDKNNEKLVKLRERYVKALVIFTERQKERNKNARIRRNAESTYIDNREKANQLFDIIEIKDVLKVKGFIGSDKEENAKEITREPDFVEEHPASKGIDMDWSFEELMKEAKKSNVDMLELLQGKISITEVMV